MFDLEEEDIYIPNTKVIRKFLEGLNYSIKPISSRERRDPVACKSICFSEWIEQFDAVKRSDTMYYCMNKPSLTEEQSVFVMNILHVCTDYATFKEALQQYINKPLE